jgi:L,D-transpeptidase ErfK/SrfK
VENRVPEGANWNGKDEMLFTAEELEAALSGTVAPKKEKASAPKRVKKTATAPAGGSASGSR